MRLHRLAALLLACLPIPAAPLADAWLPALEIAAGGGNKGPWRQNDSRYDYVDDATVAFTQDGDLAIAWVDQRRKEVLLQLRGPDGRARAAPVDVSRSPATFSWMPRLAAGGPSTLHVLWQEIIFSGGSHGGDILYARSLDGGRSFSAPLNLSASRAGDGKGRLTRDNWSNGSLDVAASPNGSVHATWTDYEGGLWLARSRDGGRSFGAPRRIAGDDARPARAPSLAVGAGGVYLAWTVGEDADADIRVAHGAGRPVLVGAPGARADAPRLALDRNGRLHLVYLERRGQAPAAIRYARAEDGLAFGPPRTLSLPGDAAGAPHLALDGAGRVHVAWDTPPRGLRYTVDGGAGFSRPAVVPYGAGAGERSGSQQGLLGKKLAAGDGLVALVDSSLAPGRASRVWLMRRRSSPD